LVVAVDVRPSVIAPPLAKTARLTGLGTGTVHRLKREMTGAS